MSFIRRYLALIAGLVLLLLGAGPAVWGITVAQTASFGWSAYAPLTSTTFTPAIDFGPIGVIAVLVGMVLAAGWLGHRIANRTTRGFRGFWLLAVGVLFIVGSFLISPPTEYGTSYLVGSPLGQVPFLPWAFAGPLIERLLVFLAGFGCVAWWAGAQIARRRRHPRSLAA